MRKLGEQVRVLHIAKSIDVMEWDQYRDHPGWHDAIRSTAARALAEEIIRYAELRTTDPDTNIGRGEFRWTVEVVMPGEAFNHFEAQLLAAKDQGYISGMKAMYDMMIETQRRWHFEDTVAARKLNELITSIAGNIDRAERAATKDPGAIDAG